MLMTDNIAATLVTDDSPLMTAVLNQLFPSPGQYELVMENICEDEEQYKGLRDTDKGQEIVNLREGEDCYHIVYYDPATKWYTVYCYGSSDSGPMAVFIK